MDACGNSRVGWIGLVAAAGLLTGAAGGQSVMLKPKFEPGRESYIERTTNISQTTKAPMFGEQGMKLKMTLLFGLVEKVETASPEGVKLKLTYDRVKVEADSPMMQGEFDTDRRHEDESPEFEAIFGPMMGMSLAMEVGSDLEVKSFSGAKDMVAKMRESAGANMLFEQISANMTDEQFKLQWGEMRFVLYPNKEVKQGDRWEKSLVQDDPHIGKLKTTYEFTVDKIGEQGGRRVAEISYTGTITQPEEPKTNEQGIKAKISNGTLKGKATFDAELARYTNHETESEMKFDLEMGSGEQTMKMNIDQHTRDTIKVLPLSDREKQKAAAKESADKAKPAGGAKPGESKTETKPDSKGGG